MSAREQLISRLLVGEMVGQQLTIGAECHRLADLLHKASEAHAVADDERKRMENLAETLRDAGSSLDAVTQTCNDILKRVGSSDAPVAKALRDVALKVQRDARGKYVYL